jgi:hypothetical protein
VTEDGTLFEGNADAVWLLATGAEIIAAYACRGPATTAAASATATHTRTNDRSPGHRPIPPSNLPLARSSYEPGSPERSGAEQGIVALAGGSDPAEAERSSAGMAGGVEGSVTAGELVFGLRVPGLQLGFTRSRMGKVEHVRSCHIPVEKLSC